MKFLKNKKQVFAVVTSVVCSVFLVAVAAYAATTIGNDVSVGGTLTTGGNVTVGTDGTGYDVRFNSDTAGAYALWDASERRLYLEAVDVAGANLSPLHAQATIDGATGYYYGLQSDISKSGTTNIDDMTAVTASIQIGAGDFTTTGRVAPLQALIWGDGWDSKVITGEVYAAWIANRGTMTSTDAVLCLHNQASATATSGLLLDLNGATVTNAIELPNTAHVDYGIEMNGATIDTADIRLSSGAVIQTGDDSGLVENTTDCPAKGSIFLGDSGKLWVCNSGTKWSVATITTP